MKTDSSVYVLAKLRETAGFCAFANLKAVDSLKTYVTELQIIVNSQPCEHKNSVYIDYSKNQTKNETFIVIQQRKEPVPFVQNQSKMMKRR